MRDNTLVDLRVICTDCELYNTGDCGSRRCVKCVVDKNPDSGCSGINSCRRGQVQQLNTCRIYRLKQWDS
jgi:hypothetical protein